MYIIETIDLVLTGVVIEPEDREEAWQEVEGAIQSVDWPGGSGW